MGWIRRWPTITLILLRWVSRLWRCEPVTKRVPGCPRKLSLPPPSPYPNPTAHRTFLQQQRGSAPAGRVEDYFTKNETKINYKFNIIAILTVPVPLLKDVVTSVTVESAVGPVRAQCARIGHRTLRWWDGGGNCCGGSDARTAGTTTTGWDVPKWTDVVRRLFAKNGGAACGGETAGARAPRRVRARKEIFGAP